MPGNHNSGRKSAREEFSKNKTIKKAWMETDANMTHADAVAIALKDMTEKKDHSGQLTVVQITGMKILSDGT